MHAALPIAILLICSLTVARFIPPFLSNPSGQACKSDDEMQY